MGKHNVNVDRMQRLTGATVTYHTGELGSAICLNNIS